MATELQIEFQFHYGSIKIYHLVDVVVANQCFNSTMVRLKSTRATCVTTVHFRFQFHYGSIKIFILIVMNQFVFCFNSTMVRLKLIEY